MGLVAVKSLATDVVRSADDMIKRKLIEYEDGSREEETKKLKKDMSHDIVGISKVVPYQQPRHAKNCKGVSLLSETMEKSDENTSLSGSLKVQKLLEALENVIQSAPELGQQAIDEDVVSKCNMLWNFLKKPRNGTTEDADSRTKSLTTPLLPRTTLERSVPEVPPLSFITPWTSSSIPADFPNIPGINNLKLETEVFTHSGVSDDPSALGYERLEWIGDAYCYLISTLLIAITFPSYDPGRCAQIREVCIRNETLASYARKYGFQTRVRLPVEFLQNQSSNGKSQATEKKRRKVLGDIFEAYVAAVIMSDAAHGVERCICWLKPLWAQTISKYIIQQEHQNAQAKIRGPQKFNPKDMLFLKICCKGIKIAYRESSPPGKDKLTHLPVFSMGVYYQALGEPETLLAVGTGSGKGPAGMKAAEMVLENSKLLRKLEGKKKMLEEGMQNAREQDMSIQNFVESQSSITST